MKPSTRGIGASLGLAPFLLYVGIFLVVPTVVVFIQAFVVEGSFSLAAIESLKKPTMVEITTNTVILSLATAVLGAVIGALVAYVVSTANPDGLLRRFVTSLSGVLAQFGGVTLAFAFIATVGRTGVVSGWLNGVGLDITNSTWLFSLKGLTLVYTYFQIPLMVIVFLPALDGIRPQWREAAGTLGASTWQYWRHVGVPLLFPAFLGSTLLLFANAFAAYATAAALINQGSPILALKIGNSLGNEVLGSQANIAAAIALEMVVIVAAVMFAYSRLQKRTSGWLR
ncbi:MAG: ABC transporter permease subunit [Propionibacteriales bacterium]|nr:ABC transporter permease subunit [Propionibacteriales bacterium]